MKGSAYWYNGSSTRELPLNYLGSQGFDCCRYKVVVDGTCTDSRPCNGSCSLEF